MQDRGFVLKIVFLFGGFIVWFAHFSAVYGLNGLACARGFAGNMVLGVGFMGLAILILTIVALAFDVLILAMAVVGGGPGIGDEAPSLRRFWRLVAGGGAAFSIVAVLWSALPVLIIAPCA